MRPALGNELAVIVVRTTRSLCLLDFTLLAKARPTSTLSYFQPDFKEVVAKQKFLRKIQRLISQPVVPGRESDYLITQTMAEFLAHVCVPNFDGILFESVQRKAGVNVVLFGKPNVAADSTEDAFGIAYVEDSIALYRTTSIQYKHAPLKVDLDANGDSTFSLGFDDHDDDE